MPELGTRFTPTSGYLNDRRPRTPHPRELFSPTPRLSLGAPGPKSRWSVDEFAGSLVSNLPPGTRIFCDTNIFSTPLDARVWDAILTRSLAVTPLVRIELQPWMQTPHHNHSIARLVQNPLAANPKLFYPDRHHFCRVALQHYIDLLAHRKRHGSTIYGQLQRSLGQNPTAREFEDACRQSCGHRGHMLAIKGHYDRHKSTFLADEELVVMAVFTAVLDGCDVAILSRDRDIEEQFVKLFMFLKHDYLSLFAAQDFSRRPARYDFETFQIPHGRHIAFAGPTIRACTVPYEEIESLRPASSLPVRIHSLTIGDDRGALRVSTLTFFGETSMREILQMKSSTKGKNTDLLGSMNMRLGTFKQTNTSVLSIVEDRMVQVGNSVVAALDRDFSLRVDEPIAAYCGS